MSKVFRSSPIRALLVALLATGCLWLSVSAADDVPPWLADVRQQPLRIPSGYSVRMFDRACADYRRSARLEAGARLDRFRLLRRLYLDLIGRPPKPSEIRACMEKDGFDVAEQARALVLSPEFALRWGRFWREVMTFRVEDPDDHIEPEVLERWLAREIYSGKSWGDTVTALVTARGRSDLDGPANFVLAHMARPNELASETARVFLGVNISCAECHDDPAGQWKREDFHGFAALFARLDERRLDREPPPDLPPDVAPPPPPFEIVVLDPLGKEYEMPHPDDPKRTIPVRRPRLLNGFRLPPGLTDYDRRAALAAWLTTRKNFWFARAYVNRIAFEVLAAGFSDSPDDIGPGRPLRTTRLLYGLASAWSRSEYDPRWLMYALVRTDIYARRAREEERLSFLTGVPPRRLNAFQLEGALCVLFGRERTQIPQEVRSAVERLFAIDPSARRADLPPTVDQLLFLLNNPLIERALRETAYELVRMADGPEQLVHECYLRALSRPPTEDELRAALRALVAARLPEKGAADLLWALMNRPEFLYTP